MNGRGVEDLDAAPFFMRVPLIDPEEAARVWLAPVADGSLHE